MKVLVALGIGVLWFLTVSYAYIDGKNTVIQTYGDYCVQNGETIITERPTVTVILKCIRKINA